MYCRKSLRFYLSAFLGFLGNPARSNLWGNSDDRARNWHEAWQNIGLAWKNIDLDGRSTVRVTQSLEQTRESGLRFKSAKTDRALPITLPSYGIDELNRLRREQAERLLVLGSRQSGETLVCCREDGEPIQPRSLTKEFTRHMDASLRAIENDAGTN